MGLFPLVAVPPLLDHLAHHGVCGHRATSGPAACSHSASAWCYMLAGHVVFLSPFNDGPIPPHLMSPILCSGAVCLGWLGMVGLNMALIHSIADLHHFAPGEELIYLDPHTTQPAVELTDGCFIPDETFHCQHPPCRMGIGELDPSIAVVCPSHVPHAKPVLGLRGKLGDSVVFPAFGVLFSYDFDQKGVV